LHSLLLYSPGCRLPANGNHFFLEKTIILREPGEMPTGHISRLNPKWKNLIPIQIW
jgi:hypothetical protein